MTTKRRLTQDPPRSGEQPRISAGNLGRSHLASRWWLASPDGTVL